MQDANYFYIFKWVYNRLQSFRKKQFWIIFIGLFLAASLETIALGTIAFFASAVTDPANVLSSKYVFFIKQVINADFLNSQKGIIIGSGLVMCLLILLKNSAKAVANYGISIFSGAAEAYFGNILLEGFIRMPYQWHLEQNTADLINALQWRMYLGRYFFQPCLKIFNDALIISILLVSLFVVQPVISFIVLSVLGSASFFVYKVIKDRIDKVATSSRDYQLLINKESAMAIQGVKDVKIYGCEGGFISKYIEKAVPLSKIFGLQKVYGESPAQILETVGFGMLYLSICIMLLKLDITTAYMTGTMALLAITAWKVLPAVSQILNSLSIIRESLPFIQTLVNYITLIEANKNTDEHPGVDHFSFTDSIEFKNVCFSYQADGLKIIENMSFTICKGETVGIIGTSGSGKSTLVDLLIGLLRPDEGEIFIDQQVLSDEIIPNWLKIVGYVQQSPYIYDGRLVENIAFGLAQERIDRPWVKKCCGMASMEDFVNHLPEKMDSFIGERGIKLSGGQQQRVAIARALYRRPEVMIFDEATSSLDSKSEKSIQKTIYSFKGKQTLIIIAHRLSTVQECDKVIWLENGRVKMSGKPEKILEQYNFF